MPRRSASPFLLSRPNTTQPENQRWIVPLTNLKNISAKPPSERIERVCAACSSVWFPWLNAPFIIALPAKETPSLLDCIERAERETLRRLRLPRSKIPHATFQGPATKNLLISVYMVDFDILFCFFGIIFSSSSWMFSVMAGLFNAEESCLGHKRLDDLFLD